MKNHSDFSGSKLLKGSLRFHYCPFGCLCWHTRCMFGTYYLYNWYKYKRNPRTHALNTFFDVPHSRNYSRGTSNISCSKMDESRFVPFYAHLALASCRFGFWRTIVYIHWSIITAYRSHSRFFCRGFNDRSSAKRIIIFLSLIHI